MDAVVVKLWVGSQTDATCGYQERSPFLGHVHDSVSRVPTSRYNEVYDTVRSPFPQVAIRLFSEQHCVQEAKSIGAHNGCDVLLGKAAVGGIAVRD